MEFDIKKLRENGYIVTKKDFYVDVIRKKNGDSFTVWVGNVNQPHCAIVDVTEVTRDYEIIEDITLRRRGKIMEPTIIGSIFGTKKIEILRGREDLGFL